MISLPTRRAVILGAAGIPLAVRGAEPSQVFTGAGPGKDPAERIPPLIIRRRGRNARCEAVHEFA